MALDTELAQKLAFIQAGGDPYGGRRKGAFEGIAQILQSVKGLNDYIDKRRSSGLYTLDQTTGKIAPMKDIPIGVGKDQIFQTSHIFFSLNL